MVTMSRLSRNTLTLLTSNIGSAALSFLLSVLIGRALGQEGLGIYTAALAWVLPLALVAEFGIATLMTRDLAQEPETEPDIIRSAVLARLWLGGGLTVLLVFAAPLLSSDLLVVRGLQISAPLVIVLPFFSIFTAIFRARQVMWPIPWLNIGMLVVQVTLTAWIFLRGGDVLMALAVNTLTSAGQLIAAWCVWRRWFKTPPPNPLLVHGEGKMLSIYRLLRRAWPFALAAVLAALQLRLNTIMLERLTSTAEVGYYAAATRFVEAGRVIPNAVFGALLPALTAVSTAPQSLEYTFRRTMFILAAFGGALAVVTTLFAPAIMALTYGEAFAPAVPALVVAMWALLPAVLRGGRTLYWYAQGHEQYTNTVASLTLVFQVLFGLWLIPRYGALGAAFVTLITETLALVLLWWPVSGRLLEAKRR
jgi:O-antigen/teichoic acid export membrane protein